MNKENVIKLELKLSELWNDLDEDLTELEHHLFRDSLRLLKEFRTQSNSQEFVKED